MNATQTKFVLKNMSNKNSVLLVAKHGVGKSSLARQVADEQGIEFVDVRLSQCEVGDIKGLPYLDKEAGRTRFLKPWWWPKDPESKGIIMFDEMNRAMKDVIQAVFEVCYDRRLDGEDLPPGWRVVAAINGSDDYDVIELDPAFLDRWFYIEFDPTAKEWMAWAAANGVHPSIIDFSAQNEDYLDPPVGSLEAGKVYQSRRSWVKFNETCKDFNLWNQTDEGLLTMVAKGWLGTAISIAFPRFYANEYSRLKAEDVLDDLERVRLKIEASAADIESIASLARNVIGLLKKRLENKEDNLLDTAQKTNLREFMQLLPKDVASQFWLDLLTTWKKEVLTWKSDTKFSSFVTSIFIGK